MIAGAEMDLYYHTWDKENSFHYYEVDFLLTSGTKIIPIEVKSSGIGKHESITEFQRKYSKYVAKEILLSQKDIGNIEMLKLYPYLYASIYSGRINTKDQSMLKNGLPSVCNTESEYQELSFERLFTYHADPRIYFPSREQKFTIVFNQGI